MLDQLGGNREQNCCHSDVRSKARIQVLQRPGPRRAAGTQSGSVELHEWLEETNSKEVPSGSVVAASLAVKNEILTLTCVRRWSH